MAEPRHARMSRSPGPRTGRRRIREVAACLAALGAAALPLQALGEARPAPVPLVADPASLVDPLIGTSGSVDTFPGPDMPFGMLQWGPDTAPDRPDGGGYEYRDTRISGFSLTHLSGPGCPAAGDVPVLPATGPLSGDLGARTAGFSHKYERSEIGYYSVTDASGITTELTGGTRAGLGRFSFPRSRLSHLLLKLSGGATRVDGTRAQAVGDREVVGAVDSGHFCGAANRYTLHFAIRFDRPFTGSGTWVGGSIRPTATSLRQGRAPQSPARPYATGGAQTPHFALPTRPSPRPHPPQPPQPPQPRSGGAPVTGANGMYLTFDTRRQQTVTAAVGISYTSDEGARRNLAAETAGRDFGALRSAAHRAWNRLLRRVAVGGGSRAAQVRFYTALYHALLHPNVFSDSDGRYAGMDGRIHRLAAGQRAQYANYSGWDTYRSQTQLMAVVAPRTAGDAVTSMLNGYDQSGQLPKWAQNNGESYIMVGDPAAGITAGAYAFGARGFDARRALRALVDQATRRSNDRPGETVRDAMGYLPFDGGPFGCCNFYGAVSTQEEYDSADYALAWFARSLGERGLYRRFAARAQDWQNLFSAGSGYLQARLADGEFAPGFTPGTSAGFVEGTAAQYTPMIPFNLRALIAARGGPAAYGAYLDSLFRHLAAPGRTDADLSNEPSLEIPWEYDYLGRPWRTQAVVRQAQRALWFNAPVGSFGNDDLGAMSSWYVWSALGMYPQTPGTPVLALGSPAFPVAELRLAGGGTVRIEAPRAAPGAPYVHRLTVNGSRWNAPWLSFDALRRGALLRYDLGTRPDTRWASAAGAAPPSDATGERPVLGSAGPGGAGLVLAPGGSGTGILELVNIGSTDLVVRWRARVPAGVILDRQAGSVTVPAGGRAEQRVRVTAGPAEGIRPVAFALRTGSGADLGRAVLRTAAARPGALWPYFTGLGVQSDGASFAGGFDGDGNAYSQQALAAAGAFGGAVVRADGIAYAWPAEGGGRFDTAAMAGQTIPVGGPPGASWLGLLGAASSAPAEGSGGLMTVTYTDGGTSKAEVRFGDWTLAGGRRRPLPSNTVALATGYRLTGTGRRDPQPAYVFATRVPLAPGRQVASITLPVPDAGSAQVFAVGFAVPHASGPGTGRR